MGYAIVFENGSHAGFRDIIIERAVAEENRGIETRRQFPPPCDNALPDSLDPTLCDELIRTGKQYAVADAIGCFATNFPGFYWDSESDAALRKWFMDDVQPGTTFNQTLFM